MLGRFVLTILAIGGFAEVLYGATVFNAAPAVFQQIAGVVMIGFGLLLIAICIGFGIVSEKLSRVIERESPGVRDSRGVGPGLM